MLPLLHTLRFGRFQYVSLLTILACLFLFLAQQRSETAVDNAIQRFCANYDPSSASSALREGWRDRRDCEGWIGFIDGIANAEKLTRNYQYYYDGSGYRYNKETVDSIFAEYERYKEDAPVNITRLLMNYPDSLNPLQIIGSSLIHADIWHLLFNLLFFFPFAMMVEPAIHNWRRYLDALVMISIAVSVSFSTTYLMSFGHMMPWPALGLSGVVTGVMGLAAYIMPRAKIITLLPVFNIPITIPLWFLSAWYIGWDMVDLANNDPRYAGTTFLAHVTGGLTGYGLGRWWFADRKAEIHDELQHAIDDKPFSLYMIHKPLSHHSRKQMEERDQQKKEKRERDTFIYRLYQLNNSQRFEETRKHLEEHAGDFFRSDEDKDQLYETIRQWQPSAFQSWFALKTIARHCHNNHLKAALQVCDDFIDQLPDATLETPLHVMPLAKLAMQIGKPGIAFALTCNITERYQPGELDMAGASMLAALSLDEATGDTKEALHMARQLYSKVPASREKEIRQLISELEKRLRKKQRIPEAIPD